MLAGASLVWRLIRRKRDGNQIQWVPASDLHIRAPAVEPARPPGLEDVTVEELLSQLPIVIHKKDDGSGADGGNLGSDSIPAARKVAALKGAAQGSQELASEELQPKVTKAATQLDLNDEQWEFYNQGDGCVICLEDWEEGDEVVILACKHRLHKACLLDWAKRQPFGKERCPLCSKTLFLLAEDDDKASAPDLPQQVGGEVQGGQHVGGLDQAEEARA